jgi:serine/threonine-protein kinase
MSPEQLTGEGSIDARTDVWALGAIAYRCVVGRPAFGTGTSSEIAARVTTSNPTPPSEAVASLPPELDDVFARALAREPKDRYASARDFAEALARGASGALITEEGLQSTNDGVVAVRPPKKTRRKAWAAVVLLLALVSLATIVRVWRAPTATSVPHTVAAEPRETFVAPVASPWSSGASPASSTAQPSTNVSATTSASASALPPVPSGKAKALPKVIDTWNKKDEL